MADSWKQKVHPKTFCGEVKAGDPPKHNLPLPRIVVNMSDEEIKEEVEKNYQKNHLDFINLLFKELNDPV